MFIILFSRKKNIQFAVIVIRKLYIISFSKNQEPYISKRVQKMVKGILKEPYSDFKHFFFTESKSCLNNNCTIPLKILEANNQFICSIVSLRRGRSFKFLEVQNLIRSTTPESCSRFGKSRKANKNDWV